MDWQRPVSSGSSLQQNGAVSMFQTGPGGRIVIHDGQFTLHNTDNRRPHNCHDADDGFKHLLAHVAARAFDAVQQVDAPKCHPNTRNAVLYDIAGWIVPAGARTQWILWLHGAAGAGKSAIGRSIVEICLFNNVPVARFFFFRTDGTRNNINPVVATLAYQLIQLIPALSAIITDRICANPLIFQQSLNTQLKSLIFEPLERLYREFSFPMPVVLLCDGVDECNNDNSDQEELIHTVGEFVVGYALPVIAFFGSRAESQLKSAFRSPVIEQSLLQLPLDNHYLPDNDIRLFVEDSFAKIRITHSFAHLLPVDWPTRAGVECIVRKSSGQFIHASVAMNFVSDARRNPAQQLDIIRGLRPFGRLAPFAQLDLLYHNIFAQVQDLSRVALILAALIFSTHVSIMSPWYFKHYFGIEEDDLHVALDDLAAVVSCKLDAVRFLHASLPDFLLDKKRSGVYYLDQAGWSARLAEKILRHVDRRLQSAAQVLFVTNTYLTRADPTAYLKESILAFHLDQFARDNDSVTSDLVSCCCAYLDSLQRLDFGDGPGGGVYVQQANMISSYISSLPQRPRGSYKREELRRLSQSQPCLSWLWDVKVDSDSDSGSGSDSD